MNHPPPPSSTNTPIASTVDSGLPPFAFAADGGRLTSVTGTPIPGLTGNVEVRPAAEPVDGDDLVVRCVDAEVFDGCLTLVVECRDVGRGDVGRGDVGRGVVRGAAGPGSASAGAIRGAWPEPPYAQPSALPGAGR